MSVTQSLTCIIDAIVFYPTTPEGLSIGAVREYSVKAVATILASGYTTGDAVRNTESREIL